MLEHMIAAATQTAGRASGRIASACAVCHAWPAQALCTACIERFTAWQPRCLLCAIALPAGTPVCGQCIAAPPPLSRCIAAVAWDWPFSDLIGRLKFGRAPGWAEALAPLLHETQGVRELLADADLLLPLPLAPERLRERGFNQALALARHLAPDKTCATLLLRIRHSAPQASLARAARLANVRGAFAVDPLRLREIAGRKLVLIDDVMTTGATLFEAARTLRATGAAEVSAIVLARTDDPRGPLTA